MRRYSSSKRIRIGILLIFATVASTSAQNPLSLSREQILLPYTRTDSISALSVSFRSQAFLKNDEYFGLITEGYTLFGYWANPGVSYQLSDELSLHVGAWAQKYFGLDSLSKLCPSYTATYTPSEHFQLELGDVSWECEDIALPLLNEERALISPQHEGLLIRAKGKRIYSTTWIEWEEFLFAQENKQEELNLWTNNQLLLVDADNWKLSLPFQAVVHHQGGQINAYPKKPLVMVLNNAAGANLGFTKGKFGFGVNYLFCGYKDLASVPYSLYANGNGHLLSLTGEYNGFTLGYTFWKANQYISSVGTQMFNTVGDVVGAPYNETYRELSVPYFKYRKQIAEHAVICAGATGYYDHNNGGLDYYYWVTIAMNIEKNIRFTHKKQEASK